MANHLRSAAIGARCLGTDHIERLMHRITGADVTSVVAIDAERVRAAAALARDHVKI